MIELTQIEIISGFASIIGLIFTFVLGFIIIAKYLKYKDINLLLMGLVIILASQAWWPYAITLILFFAGADPLTLQMHILFGFGLQVIALFIGNFVMTNLMWKDKVKLVMALTAIYGALFQTVLFYAIFVDPSSFATLEGNLDVSYQSLLALFLFINIMLILFFAFFFFLHVRKSAQPEIRLKGTLYFIAIIFFTIGAILDAILPLSLPLLVIVRALLALSGFGTYVAFTLPNWAKKILIKEK